MQGQGKNSILTHKATVFQTLYITLHTKLHLLVDSTFLNRRIKKIIIKVKYLVHSKKMYIFAKNIFK